ncbi:ParB N-terminal domain-containing protein [Sedimentitalea sp. JM2-8]|uniref:ParB N-terminal domain-containing protein n=1 Tax=Sedimentitalea xiamensis TaxID=3050037 RepID=A0ABT7FDL0_9RHOB|nr:ParB N-terminal domain-containing protein [Sedimentitalea xiamensis]MDK3073210.1 ParB N-terminal domain-containing protein [Sedimentitalea xiamensis]
MLEKRSIALTDIRVPAKRARTLDAAKVQQIAEDMIDNGQTTPIRVRSEGAGFILVEGLHRLEALRALGESSVTAYLVHARLH